MDNHVPLFVVSSGRPMNVGKMQTRGLPKNTTWAVKAHEEAEYRTCGATKVLAVEDSTSVTDQRQAVLSYAYDHSFEYVAMIDDDLQRLKVLDIPTGNKHPCAVAVALDYLQRICRSFHVNYAGVGPTDNAYFVKKFIHLDKYVRSAFIVIRMTDPPIMYDTEFRVKEDYDYSAQQLEAFGRIGRVDSLLASFSYKTNRGGCQDYRCSEVEQEAIARLHHKWGSRITTNTRRQDEVFLRWK